MLEDVSFGHCVCLSCGRYDYFHVCVHVLGSSEDASSSVFLLPSHHTLWSTHVFVCSCFDFLFALECISLLSVHILTPQVTLV